MENPKYGGVWIRDPETGALQRLTQITDAEPEPERNLLTPEAAEADPVPSAPEPEPAAATAASAKKKGR